MIGGGNGSLPGSLLGYETSTDPGILKIMNNVKIEKDIMNDYKHVFKGIGKLKDVKVKLHNQLCQYARLIVQKDVEN